MDPKQQAHVRQSLLGCRVFYALMYSLQYAACLLYRNPLS